MRTAVIRVHRALDAEKTVVRNLRNTKIYQADDTFPAHIEFYKLTGTHLLSKTRTRRTLNANIIYSTVKKETVPVTHSREHFITQLRDTTSIKEKSYLYDIV